MRPKILQLRARSSPKNETTSLSLPNNLVLQEFTPIHIHSPLVEVITQRQTGAIQPQGLRRLLGPFWQLRQRRISLGHEACDQT
jgi:hypothetical protein